MIIFQSKLFSSYLIRSRFPIHKAFFTPKTVTGIFPQNGCMKATLQFSVPLSALTIVGQPTSTQ